MTDAASNPPAHTSGTLTLGGDLAVHRLGFGAMRITGDGVWGPPADHDESIRVLRRAVELGIDLIDTADSYGPFVSEDLIAEALHPYAEGLVIATKGGLTRSGPGIWEAVGRPEYLRQCLEMSLRRLRLDRIDLYQFHRVDPQVPLTESLGALVELQAQGKIRHIGVSNVTLDELRSRAVGRRDRVGAEPLQPRRPRERGRAGGLHREGIGFIPWFPVATGQLARPGGPLDQAARDHGATPAQLALAWLLHHSPVTLPIPGTSSVAHLEENTAAATIRLGPTELAALEAAT